MQVSRTSLNNIQRQCVTLFLCLCISRLLRTETMKTMQQCGASAPRQSSQTGQLAH
jgi:hypothetical protein